MIGNNIKIFKILSDKTRLKIIASLNKQPMYVELLAERLGINPSTVSFHLKKMENQDIVSSKKEQYYIVYHLNKKTLNFNVMEIINSIDQTNSEEKREQEYNQKVLNSFFKGNKLVSIPVQRKKREIILYELAKSFELNKEYTEREVNIIISEFHDDFCTIRREFIIYQIFTRENGIYIRKK